MGEVMTKPGSTLAYWLAEALQEVREHAGAKTYDISALVRREERTVRRVEKGDHIPNDLESWLSAYAVIGGIADPRDLVRRAVDLWYKDGTAPALTGDLAADPQAEGFAAAFRRAAEASAPGDVQGPGAPHTAPPSKGHRRRAAG
jgi:hypothetical protein